MQSGKNISDGNVFELKNTIKKKKIHVNNKALLTKS